MFSRPPILKASFGPQTLTYAQLESERVSRTIRCIKRLRPEWEEGAKLYENVIGYIGHVAGKDYDVYDATSPIRVTFRIQVEKGAKISLNDTFFETFDEVYNVYNSTFYGDYTLTFLWWKWDNCEEQLKSMILHVESLLPGEVFSHPHGVECDDDDDLLLLEDNACFSDCAEEIFQIIQNDLNSVDFTFTMWISANKNRINV